MKKNTRRFITASITTFALAFGGVAYLQQVSAATYDQGISAPVLNQVDVVSQEVDTTDTSAPSTTCPNGHENCLGQCVNNGECDGTQQGHHQNSENRQQHQGNHQNHGGGNGAHNNCRMAQ